MSRSPVRTERLTRGAAIGALGGALGSIVMIGYAMVVSFAYKDVGFFTPLYHIGSSIGEPAAMMASMEAAMAGDGGFFDAGPAALGFVVHLVTGVAAGAVFGALVSLLSLRRATTVAAGVAYGLAVMVGNAYIGLPIAAELFGGGDPIADMPSMAGWGTFFVEHVLFGLVLGLVVAMAGTAARGRTRERETADAAF